MNGAASYRPDIDGLRALAVLAVIAFHARPAAVPGGFTGVDLFFVISGYLITRLIRHQLAHASFSLADFYNRRLKRILPAYCAVALATLVASSLLLIPDDFLFYTSSLAASWAFASNQFFALLSWGYFGQRTEQFPLLHTWSLGVEEQFYFLYPLLLMLLWRHARRASAAVVLALALTGLALSEWRAGSNAGFYLLPFRCHELLAGALCAYLLEHWTPGPRQALACGVVGLSLVLGGLLLLDRERLFPGLNSLFPCGGAALLIIGGARANLVSRLFALRPMVAIGLISYSLYLWHWPIFSLLHYRRIALDGPVLALAVTLSFALAYLSWRWIEQPWRERRSMRLGTSLPLLYGIPAACFIGVGAVSYASEGIPQRFDAGLRQLMASYSFERDLTGACAIKSGQYRGVTLDYLQSRCTVGTAGGPPAVLLFGDSHANHFKPFVEQLTQHASQRMAYFVEGSCEVIDLAEGGAAPTDCQRRNADLLALSRHFGYVVVASRWQYKGREALFARRLEAVVQAIESGGAHAVVIKDSPSVAADLSRCVLYRLRGWQPAATDCSMAAHEVAAAQGSMDGEIDALARRYPALIVIDPKRVMCDDARCATYIGNTALYKDDNHLNTSGARLLGQRYLAAAGNPFERAPSLAWKRP